VSVTWYDSVAITVEVAFGSDPLDGAPSWTDISAYVLEIPNIASGRSSEFTQISPSTLSVVLSNTDRRFDPEHAAGPYFGDLLPGKKIRVSVVYSAVTYYLFTGFVQGWPQEYQSSVDSTVTISAVDGSRFLEQAILNRSAYEAAVLADDPAAYWPLQERNSISTPFDDLVSGQELTAVPLRGATPVALAYPTNDVVGASNAITALPDPAVSAATVMFGLGFSAPAEPLAIEAWVFVGPSDSSFQLGVTGSSSSRTVQVLMSAGRWTISASSVTLNRHVTPTLTVAADSGGWMHIAAVLDVSNLTLYINGQVVAVVATSVGTFVNSGVSTVLYANGSSSDCIAHHAVYTTSPTAARIQDHYLAGLTAYGHPFGERSGARIGRVLDEIGWPAGDRDIGDGDTVHGPYVPSRQSAMKYMRDVETAEDGYLFLDGQGRVVLRDRQWQWTQTVSVAFSDTPAGAEIDYTDIEIDANSIAAIRTSVSASYDDDGYLFSEDAAARQAYGPAREPLSTPTIESAAQARALTAYKLRAMKDPQTRITGLTHTPRILNATAWPKILGLMVGARVTVERHPQAVGSAIVKTLVVQGVEHRIDPVWWETRLYLSPAPDTYIEGPYLLTGDATYGKTGAVAGNKVAF
jgi:hypothetical protein